MTITESLAPRLSMVETQQARTEERLRHVENALDECVQGVRQLLSNDAARPIPTSWRAVAGTVVSMLGGLVIVGGFVFWLVAQTPAVTDLQRTQRSLQRDVSTVTTELRDVQQTRFTAKDHLIACLRAQIANQHIRYRCPDDESAWQARVARPQS